LTSYDVENVLPERAAEEMGVVVVADSTLTVWSDASPKVSIKALSSDAVAPTGTVTRDGDEDGLLLEDHSLSWNEPAAGAEPSCTEFT
jgi:hypothetical protein